MKTRILIALTLLVSLTLMQSCSKVVVVERDEPKSHVQVTVSPFSLTMEDMGTATRNDLSNSATRISFAVYDSEGSLVDEVIHQVSSASDFGKVEMELSPGTYSMVAVAHSGTENAVINSASSVTLPGNTFTDTFSDVAELEVELGEDYDITMNLPRSTSAFMFRITDAPPADAKEIKVMVNFTGLEPTSLNINPDTRLAQNTWKQTRVIPIADISEDVLVYFIGMNNPTTVTVKAAAYDTEDNEIISHTIPNVTMTTGQRSVATGNFFPPEVSTSFTVDSDWGEDNIINF